MANRDSEGGAQRIRGYNREGGQVVWDAERESEKWISAAVIWGQSDNGQQGCREDKGKAKLIFPSSEANVVDNLLSFFWIGSKLKRQKLPCPEFDKCCSLSLDKGHTCLIHHCWAIHHHFPYKPLFHPSLLLRVPQPLGANLFCGGCWRGGGVKEEKMAVPASVHVGKLTKFNPRTFPSWTFVTFLLLSHSG